MATLIVNQNQDSYFTRQLVIENLEQCEIIDENQRMDPSGLYVERVQGQTISTFAGISEAVALARPHFEEIYNTGGSFSVRVSAALMLADGGGNLHDFWMSFRPLDSNDEELRGGAVLVGGVAAGARPPFPYRALLSKIIRIARQRIEQLKDVHSMMIVSGIHTVVFDIAPGRALGSLPRPPHLIVAAGTYVPLPDWLIAKKAIVNIKNTDFYCLIYCCILWKKGYHNMKRKDCPHDKLHNWPTANYCCYEDGTKLMPGKQTQKKVPIDVGMDFSMVPGDKPSEPEVLDALEAANPGLSVWVYEVLEIETQNESRKEFVCTRRSQVEVANADDELRLFYYHEHYSFITDIDRLLSMEAKTCSQALMGAPARGA